MSYRTGLHPSLDAELAEQSTSRLHRPGRIEIPTYEVITDMSIVDAMRREREETERVTRLGYERARESKYGTLKLTARMYAIIEFAGVSADLMMKDHPVGPLGLKSFRFVEGCERMTHSDCQARYRQLLIAELRAKEEKQQ